MPSIRTFADMLRAALAGPAVTPKRAAVKLTGADAWFKYYAGYSPDFARAVLGNALLSSGELVLDPWNGSGTTTYSAAALGFSAIGLDISPVANIVAAAKMANPADLAHSSGLTRQILALAPPNEPAEAAAAAHPLREWMHVVDVVEFVSIYRAILHLLAQPHRGAPVDPLVAPPPPLAAFFILCLLRAARIHARAVPSSNPTWFRPPRRRLRLSSGHGHVRLSATFSETVASLTSRPLPDHKSGGTFGSSMVLAGDSRRLPLADASVDFVLTSPPYCTRLDYPVSTQLELSALGMSSTSELRELRRASMGTPLVRPPGDAGPQLPVSIQSLLDRIRRHPSKNSDSYYLSTYKQYFADAHSSLSEMRRVLRPGGRAVLVLQTSFYKEIPVPLPDLFLDLAGTLKFDGTTVREFPVNQVLASMNPQSRRHVAQKSYCETVIALQAA